jgi:hypothetical protein
VRAQLTTRHPDTPQPILPRCAKTQPGDAHA